MIKFSSLFLSVLLLISCRQTTQPAGSTSDTTAIDTLAIVNDAKNNVNVQTNTFSEIDTSGILMFPLSIGKSDGDDYLDYDRSANMYWNIIFYNSHNSEYHLLTNKKILISSYHDNYNTSGSNGSTVALSEKHIFYRVVAEDYNEDKKFSRDDPEYLFVSDKGGNNFRQISPAGYQLINWQFIRSTNKIIMTVIKDTEKNKKFGDKDEVATFQIDMDKDSLPTEIFSTDFKNKLKVMFEKDWKQAKD